MKTYETINDMVNTFRGSKCYISCSSDTCNGTAYNVCVDRDGYDAYVCNAHKGGYFSNGVYFKLDYVKAW